MSFVEDFYKKWIHGTYIYKLDRSYDYQSRIKGYTYKNKWLKISEDGLIVVKKGYAWDGCTPKLNFFDLGIFGIPDGVLNPDTMKPKTYYASLVHDVLSQFYGKHGIPKDRIDGLFHDILIRDHFYLADIYYFTVSKLGHLFFRKYTVIRDDNGNEWIPERVCDE